MDIVKMNKVVVFEKSTPQDLGAGTEDSYSTVATTRGRLKNYENNRTLNAGEIQFFGTKELIIRYQDAIHVEIRNDSRILIDEVYYTIESWEKMDEKRNYLRFIINRGGNSTP
jgi:SPP1 family predicted phage head-tail adaptor